MNEDFFASEVEFFHPRSYDERAPRLPAGLGTRPRYFSKSACVAAAVVFFHGAIVTDSIRIDPATLFSAPAVTPQAAQQDVGDETQELVSTNDLQPVDVVLEREHFEQVMSLVQKPARPTDALLRAMAMPMWA